MNNITEEDTKILKDARRKKYINEAPPLPSKIEELLNRISDYKNEEIIIKLRTAFSELDKEIDENLSIASDWSDIATARQVKIDGIKEVVEEMENPPPCHGIGNSYYVDKIKSILEYKQEK